MRTLPHPSTDEISFASVMHALSDEVRLGIVARLADSTERTCDDAAEGLDVHKSTMSHHLRVLRESGLIAARQEGRHRYVRLRRDDLEARFPGLLDVVLRSLHTGSGR